MPPGSFVQFSYVSGLFQHDQQQTGPESGFRARTLPRLGIIDREYESDVGQSETLPWERLQRYLDHLNSASPAYERYKLLFVARHGEGVHNVKERKVGRHEWERYWSKIDGDETMSWVDPKLTERGLQQAQDLGEFWTNAIKMDQVAAPTSFYTSPLRRCLQTVATTWQNVAGLPPSKSPIVHESLREIFGVHTCDKRSSTSQIQAEFPYFELSPGLTADDRLWTPDHRETMQEHAELWRNFLQDLFENDESTYVSITTHSGATRALYLAIGHPDVWTAAGSVVPIVVLGRRVKPS